MRMGRTINIKTGTTIDIDIKFGVVFVRNG